MNDTGIFTQHHAVASQFFFSVLTITGTERGCASKISCPWVNLMTESETKHLLQLLMLSQLLTVIFRQILKVVTESDV